MKLPIFLTCTLILSACERALTEPAESYQRWTDRTIVQLGLPNVGIWPCKAGSATDDCYKMQPPRRWQGTWVLGPGEHEERFWPNGSQASEKQTRYDLEWNRRVFTGRPQVRAEWGKTYAVDVVGRRTEYPGQFFDFGSGDPEYMIVVDRLISMKELGASPKE